MNNSTISFEEFQKQSYILEVLFALEKGLTKYNINFYLIGTANQGNWGTNINTFNTNTLPTDIELAVFINDKNAYVNLRGYLINVENFSPHKHNSYLLKWKKKLHIYLLPFDEIEVKPSNIIIHTTGRIQLNAKKNKTINDIHSSDNQHATQNQFKFCPLTNIVLLKLITFHDYPETSRDEIKDINKVLLHFFDMFKGSIYENHSDLFNNHDINLKWVSARIIGRDMGKLASPNKELFSKIKKLLIKNSIDINTSEIGRIMSESSQNTIEENLKLLEQIKIGYLEI